MRWEREIKACDIIFKCISGLVKGVNNGKQKHSKLNAASQTQPRGFIIS